MTRIPVTKDGLALLRKQAKAAVKAGNSPLSQYSGLVFVLDGKEIPFTDVLADAGGAAQSGAGHGGKQCGCGAPQSGGQRGPIGGQTRFILSKNVAPKKR